MATFAQIKSRVAGELNRDDLATDLVERLEEHIQDACEYYADRKFWFNSVLDQTASTAASTATVSIPSGVQIVEKVTIPAYDRELIEVPLDRLDDYTGGESLPEYYAYYNDSLRFYPIPDAVYSLNIWGVAQVDAPTADATTNIWTNQAKRLIVSHTKMTLCRDVFRDDHGFELAAGAVSDHLAQMQRLTAKRLKAPLRPRMRGRRYDINADR